MAMEQLFDTYIEMPKQEEFTIEKTIVIKEKVVKEIFLEEL